MTAETREAAPAETPASPEAPESPENPDDPGLRIARLSGRVAALEAALERRSCELRRLQRLLCPHDLAQWNRVAAGLSPRPRIACDPSFWEESRELTAAEVPETLEALWESSYPPFPPAPPGPQGPLPAGGAPAP